MRVTKGAERKRERERERSGKGKKKNVVNRNDLRKSTIARLHM